VYRDVLLHANHDAIFIMERILWSASEKCYICTKTGRRVLLAKKQGKRIYKALKPTPK